MHGVIYCIILCALRLPRCCATPATPRSSWRGSKLLIDDAGDDYVSSVLNGALIHAAYHWAGGAPFHEVCEHTALLEGDIVRIFSRVEELCKEVKAAAKLLGDALLGRKLDTALSVIRRDVVAAPSLYFDGAALDV